MTAEPSFVEIARARFSLADFRRYAGEGARNHHTDEAEAQRIGLPAPLAPGAMVLSWMWMALAERWGEDWERSGRLAVTFLTPVWADDEIRLLAAGAVDADRCPVRVETADGRVAVAGAVERVRGASRGS